MLDHIAPKQARAMLLELAASCETETVSIYSALGRVLAEDCRASFPVPPFRKALPKTSSVIRLLRGHLELHRGKAFFREHSGRGNGNLSSFENCNLIGIVPPCSEVLAAGTMIEAINIR